MANPARVEAAVVLERSHEQLRARLGQEEGVIVDLRFVVRRTIGVLIAASAMPGFLALVGWMVSGEPLLLGAVIGALIDLLIVVIWVGVVIAEWAFSE